MSKTNQQPNPWYSIRARANAAAAEILIYGDIGPSWYDDSVEASEFVKQLAALDVDELTIRINSYGGSVSDGIAIHNAIKRHKAHVTIVIDAVAASVASLIAMAGDTVEMAENALMMIHAPWGYASGNSEEMRRYADMLDTWADAMATSYASKSGRDKADMLTLLTDGIDHWFTAEEALAEGFIDTVVTAVPVAASFDRTVLAQRYKSFPQVSTPAAAAAHQPQEHSMHPTAPTAAATQPATTLNEEQIRAQAVQAEATRRNGITAAFAKFSHVDGVEALRATCESDIGCTVEQANAKLLAHLGSTAQPVAAGRIVTIEDERDKFSKGVSASLMARAGLDKHDASNQFRGYSLFELARASLEIAGVKTGSMNKMELVSAAFTHSGSDFPLLLANIAHKAMLKGYEEAEETFQLWTTRGVLSDFKETSRVGLNDFPSLREVRPGAEYKYVTVGERGEKTQLATYGELFSINRQTIINDDLDAFTKIPRLMGRAAIATVGDLVYAVLTSNPNMADGKALFDNDHKNLLAAAAISTASVDAMRVAMAKQTAGGRALNIRLAHLIVPVALQGAANVVRESEYEVGASAKNNTVPNSVRNTFDVIADARLDAHSASAWYGAASGGIHDTIEVSYLDGNDAPYLEEKEGWSRDGVEFKVRIDAAVKALDFRTLAKTAAA